ncbi:MAG: hypothetical protein PHE06_16350, partial [Lachnospiraceae bacterium]|nr:hypothetical protein [Lachnospiraceae bacterium]
MTNINMKKHHWKKLLPVCGLLILTGIMIYCYLTPEYFWSYADGSRVLWKKHVLLMGLVFLFGVFVLFFPIAKLKEKTRKVCSILLFFLTPFVNFMMLEYANIFGPSLLWDKFTGLVLKRSVCSACILLFIMLLVFLISNRARISELFLCCFVSIF